LAHHHFSDGEAVAMAGFADDRLVVLTLVDSLALVTAA
jgi:hypothetical protein